MLLRFKKINLNEPLLLKFVAGLMLIATNWFFFAILSSIMSDFFCVDMVPPFTAYSVIKDRGIRPYHNF